MKKNSNLIRILKTKQFYIGVIVIVVFAYGLINYEDAERVQTEKEFHQANDPHYAEHRAGFASQNAGA